jgi:DNA-binding transcriptional LysR family regulator
MTPDLNLVAVFLAVADTRSFRGAAERLGVTSSAVSQAMRRMEDGMGVALVQRTTRSVSLTEAGQRLRERVAPAIAEVELALDHAQDRDAQPSGQLRLAVSSIAERFISELWVMLRTACAGGGLTFGLEETFRPYIARGELVPLLQEFLPPFPGFFMYFPQRRNLAPKLRALIDHMRYSPVSLPDPGDIP